MSFESEESIHLTIKNHIPMGVLEGAGRRYSVTLGDDHPTECDEATLMAGWSRVPDLTLRIRALEVGQETVVSETPTIKVKRLR